MSGAGKAAWGWITHIILGSRFAGISLTEQQLLLRWNSAVKWSAGIRHGPALLNFGKILKTHWFPGLILETSEQIEDISWIPGRKVTKTLTMSAHTARGSLHLFSQYRGDAPGAARDQHDDGCHWPQPARLQSLHWCGCLVWGGGGGHSHKATLGWCRWGQPVQETARVATTNRHPVGSS